MPAFTPKARAAIYALAVALGACATAWGLATDSQVAVLLGVVNAAIGLLAVVNVPRTPKDEA